MPDPPAVPDPPAGWGRQIARTRDALSTLVARHSDARADAGRAIVSQAELRRALNDQQRTLDRARAEVRSAIEAARDAAVAARVDGVDARGYEQAADGFVTQLAVLDGAREQVDELSGTTQGQLDQSRQVLRHTLAVLDRSLRDNLTLLTRLERLERQREIAAARSHRPTSTPAQDPPADPGPA